MVRVRVGVRVRVRVRVRFRVRARARVRAVDGCERLELLLPRGAPRLERQVRLARVRVARRLCGSIGW